MKSARPTSTPFQPTRWTLIAEANGPDKPAARAALEKLCAAYWYPLYAYVRRRGRVPEDAEDAVQGRAYALTKLGLFSSRGAMIFMS